MRKVAIFSTFVRPTLADSILSSKWNYRENKNIIHLHLHSVHIELCADRVGHASAYLTGVIDHILELKPAH